MTTATEVKPRIISTAQSIQEALVEEFRRDERVFVMGQDLQKGVDGGTAALFNEFGGERVRDCPISENAFVGAAVGAAAVGMRPIVTSSCCFMWAAMDSLISQAAKMQYMFGGQASLPLVFRMTELWGGSMAAHHSDRIHPLFMQIPGFKVVMASNPYDSKGLLKTAIREDDPVIFFEDRMAGAARGPVPLEDYTVPFGVADIKRAGSDVTIVGVGGMVNMALKAAEQLEAEGVSVEVVDPRTIVPLDRDTILESVAKTGRLVTVDIAHKRCSVASEISAMVAEHGFGSLKAPIKRVATENVHIPFSTALEPLCYPTPDKIADAVRETLA